MQRSIEYSVAETARRIDVSDRTIWRWMHDADFAVALSHARAVLRSDIASKLHGKADAAVTVIERLMNDASIPALVRLRAAQDVLDRVVGSADTQELQAQIEALEKLVNEANEYRGKGQN